MNTPHVSAFHVGVAGVAASLVASWFFYDFPEPYRGALHRSSATVKATFFVLAMLLSPVVLAALVLREVRRAIRGFRRRGR